MSFPVQSRQELIDRLLTNRDRILAFGVVRIGIFGSFARDQAREDSDVDFMIEMNARHKTLRNMLALTNLLEEISGRRIEIVTPQSLNKFTGKYILQEVEYVPLAA